MIHARLDYMRFQDPVAVCREFNLPQGQWAGGLPGPGESKDVACLIAPDGTRFVIQRAVPGPDPKRAWTCQAIAEATAQLLTCSSKIKRGIPPDEPVFLLRGQDAAAATAVREWAREAHLCGAAPDIVEAARKHADAMDRWQRDCGGRAPDLFKGAL